MTVSCTSIQVPSPPPASQWLPPPPLARPRLHSYRCTVIFFGMYLNVYACICMYVYVYVCICMHLHVYQVLLSVSAP